MRNYTQSLPDVINKLMNLVIREKELFIKLSRNMLSPCGQNRQV